MHAGTTRRGGRSLTDVGPFAAVVTLVAAAALVAVWSNRITERLRIPAPALFLLAAAIASDIYPTLGSLSLTLDTRIVTVALLFVLFDGGMRIGWRRFRTAAGAVIWLGVAGTAVTAGALATIAHGLFGFTWQAALLVGTALSPTDPAVVFSVLGRREIAGRSGTILEGESGANDPVGIALMAALLGASGAGGWHAVAGGAAVFAEQLLIGSAVGVAGGFGLRRVMQFQLPSEALYPLRVLAAAALIYGISAVLSGSGFLAVLLAGILVGDTRAPFQREVQRFASGIAGFGEILAFTVLGLTVSVREVLHSDELWVGLALAALLIFLIRPVLVGLLSLPVSLALGERAFILWSGLKGAVPILLGTFALSAGVPQARRIYGVVFVVVLTSVIVQGSLIPVLANVFRVPMRTIEPEPYALGMRFQDEPRGLQRHVVGRASMADGSTIGMLDLGETGWISMINRGGRLVQVRESTTLHAGDDVLFFAYQDSDLAHLFATPTDPVDPEHQ